MKLSYSRLSVYLDCGLQFAKKYLGEARYNEVSNALDVGKAVHWALEQTVKEMAAAAKVGLLPPGECLIPQDKVLAYYHMVDVEETGLMTYEGFNDALDIINRLDLSFDPHLVLEVEGEFDDPIPGTPHSIGGFIDRVDQVNETRIRVLDYKTGKILVEAEHNKQLMIYAWSLAKKYLWATEFELVIEMIRTGEKSSWVITRPELEKVDQWLTYIATRLEREIEAHAEDQQQIAYSIEHGEPLPRPRAFKPVIGANCQWCPFSAECLKEHPLGKPEAQAKNTMESLIEEYIRLETMGKRAYAAKYKLLPRIEAMARRTDITEVNTSLGTYRLEADMSFTLSDVWDVCKKHNTRVSPFIKVDEYKLKAAAKKSGDLAASLRSIARPKVAVVQVKEDEAAL